MARSRSRSRDRGRRRHSSSDESDYDRRKREKRKKKRRSRSRSADSDRRKYKSSSSASGYSRDRIGQKSSSRSDGRSERSHYSRRDRSRSHSPSERRRRDRSKSRSPDQRKRRERSKSKSPSKDRYDERRKDTTEDKKKEKDGTQNEGALSLKERIARLTGSSSQGGLDKLSDNTVSFEVDHEKIAEIEAQGFHQQTFVSNATKKSNGNINGSNPVETSSPSANSHENAIFGSTFSKTNSTNSLPVNGMSKLGSDDELFGPSLLIEQELRTERWLEKLMFIRQKILRESK